MAKERWFTNEYNSNLCNYYYCLIFSNSSNTILGVWNMKNKVEVNLEDWEKAINRFQKVADPIIKRNQEKIKRRKEKKK